MDDYDWHYDRDGDGELDFHERMDEWDDDDYSSKRGIYEEPEEEDDD